MRSLDSSNEGEQDEEEQTVYAVRLSEAAVRQADAALERIIEAEGPDAAEEWQEGLNTARASLATLPERCLIAPENRVFQKKRPGPPLRVLLYRHGRSAWRLLFTVHAATDEDAPRVQIHQMRHSAQKPLTRWPTEGS